ncbi:MAG: serine/threonine protein kinase [Candidatus Eisenbacteria bacterium]|nr:serine/threonine protein kinase [Candidatus Eisenbacteria bacterium]
MSLDPRKPDRGNVPRGPEPASEFDRTLATGPDLAASSGASPEDVPDRTISVGGSGPAVPERTITVGATVSASPGADPGLAGETVGRYRILGKLGEGGMGIVYEAEQQNPRRHVALKVVRGGHFVDESTVRMFQREADTLARLRHPNIGAIYESGRTDDGQHFFAMELVRGENMDVYLGRRPKAVSQDEIRFRLALFRRIAEAVHYAHQRGVIHRDLKPSNIIVTDETASEGTVVSSTGVRTPEVKILDFGLARITEGDVQMSQVTEVGVIKGTLPYMSPEQARGSGELIDVRTDVYALGVILYEMLTGSKPYDVGRGSLVEAVRVICEEAPKSLRLTMSGGRRLDPDIETIVGKALEKDVEHRYASAAAMAEDVDRYLSSQPILARPPSTLYQLQKFARRNRALVAGVAATFVVLVAGVVVSSLQAVRATRAEDLAKSRMSRALSAEALAKSRQKESEQARLLAERHQVEAEHERASALAARSAAERSRSAAVKARAAAESARESAETARAAEAAQRAAAEASGERARTEAAKATAINRFLQDMLATADPWAGEGGRVTLDAALQKAQGKIGTTFQAQPEVDFAVRRTVASAFEGVGRFAQAESLLSGGIERLSKEPDAPPGILAGFQRELGGTLLRAGEYDRAELQIREALRLQALAGSLTSDTMVSTLNQQAVAMAYRGRYTQADSVVRVAGDILRREGRERGPAAPGVLSTQAYLATNWKEDYQAADRLYQSQYDVLRSLLGDHAMETSDVLEELATNRVRLNDFTAADSLFRQALEIKRAALGDDHPLVAHLLENRGNVLMRSGRMDETLETLRRVLGIRQHGLGPESVPVGRTWTNLGSVYTRAGRLAEAEDAFTRGIGILRHGLGEQHPDLAAALRDRTTLQVQQGRMKDAEKSMREALAIRVGHSPPGSPAVTGYQFALAAILKDRRDFSGAEAILLQARAQADSARGSKDPAVAKATEALVELYTAWKKPEALATWRAVQGGQAPPAARGTN